MNGKRDAKPTVYLVDDDPAVTKAVAQLIALMGLRTESYGSAEEFLASYRGEGPGCILLDVRMPGKNGLELQQELTAAGRALPIIMITGHGDTRLAVRAMKQGAVDFLEKPFLPDELCDAVRRAIELSGAGK
ncbi:MAG TPA: response regulator transcription factor [Thermoguttaceae bacterium]|nr:response regulator transcription factor [Thermoguttaceae bacterium]